MRSTRETSGQNAGTPENAESRSPKRLTRDTQFIVTSVFVVGGLVLGQAYLRNARFDDVNDRIDALEERVNSRIDESQDDVRDIRSMVLPYLAERNQGTVGGSEAAKHLGVRHLTLIGSRPPRSVKGPGTGTGPTNQRAGFACHRLNPLPTWRHQFRRRADERGISFSLHRRNWGADGLHTAYGSTV
ncbi:MAG: hypothetical protein OXN89_00110 [Bryobacterales bacterium]|nr:hypothetical protein [Bryobacterales bacterium]